MLYFNATLPPTPDVPIARNARSMNPTKELARFVAETQPAQIPAAVLRETKRCVINVLGVALHATRDPAFEIVLDLARDEGGNRKASVLGAGVTTSLQTAAMVNGFLAHLDDYDDTLFPTVFHPAAPTLPAALAVAEYGKRSGHDFLTACALGLEVSCRLALAFEGIHNKAVWHMSGVLGSFGAAAAAGQLLALDAGTMARAFGLAGTQASGLRETFGTMTKAFHVGRANQSGLLGVLLAQRGFTCTESILEGRHGFAAAFAPDGQSLGNVTNGLREHWAMMANSPKPYACGILSHCMIDAMLALRGKPGVTPGSVKQIRGKVNPLAVKLESRPEPASGLVGRLSFQHAMAAALVDGAGSPAQFTDARVRDPVVAAVRSRIQVEADDAFGPDQCTITMTLVDGREYTQRIEHATGTPENPVTDGLLEAKFRMLAGSVLPKARVNRLLTALWHLEQIGDVGDIVELCRISRRKQAS